MLGRHPMDRGPLRLNIALQWDLELDMKVGSGSFLPAPRVRSRLVHLRAHDRPTRVSAAFLRGLVRQAFAHRRRKLGTTLRTRPTGLEDAGLRSGGLERRHSAMEIRNMSSSPIDVPRTSISMDGNRLR